MALYSHFKFHFWTLLESRRKIHTENSDFHFTYKQCHWFCDGSDYTARLDLPACFCIRLCSSQALLGNTDVVISDQTAIFCSPVCFCPKNALVHRRHYHAKLTWLFLCVLFVFYTVCANKSVGLIPAHDCTLLATVSNVYIVKSGIEIRMTDECASLISLIVLSV